MKRLFIIVLAIALVPVALAAQTSHFKVSQSGAFASVSTNPDPLSALTLNVSRGTNNHATNTNLTFSLVSVSADFSTITFTSIFGPIPDSAFTGETVNGLHLNLDTSTLDPNVTFSETCTLTLNPFDLECTTATTGVIQLDFVENDFISTQVLNSDVVTTFGPTTSRQHMKADTSTANASGSVFGIGISTTTAQVGTNKSSTLEIIRQ
jgi:hypothetical protein